MLGFVCFLIVKNKEDKIFVKFLNFYLPFVQDYELFVSTLELFASSFELLVNIEDCYFIHIEFTVYKSCATSF